MPYIPALDGLRAIAVLAVMAFHVRLPGFHAGYLGVNLFFVLSGFLITSIILASKDNFSFREFMIRRMLRLYPAVILFAAVMAFALPMVFGRNPVWELLPALTYVSNYTRILFSTPIATVNTWSLAVEFQFYLFWPLLLLWMSKRFPGKELTFTLCIIPAIIVWRLICYVKFSWDWAYYATDTRLDSLFFGCVVALVLNRGGQVRDRYPRTGAFLVIIGLAMTGVAANLSIYYSFLSAGPLQTLADFSSAIFVYLLATGGGMAARGLSLRPLVYLGKISYGIYLWHYPIAFAVRDIVTPEMAMVIVLCTSIPVAILSYELVEKRIRRKPGGHSGSSFRWNHGLGEAAALTTPGASSKAAHG